MIKTNYQIIASELFELGINVNCAPVIDLIEKRGHSVIGDRALSSDPKTVGLLGKAVVEGSKVEGFRYRKTYPWTWTCSSRQS